MIKIFITGDFCPHKRVEQIILDNNCGGVYNDFLPHLKGNDINITNLECPLTNKQNPIFKTGPNLISNEKCIEALTFGNFNILTLSNNHIMDQGADGLLSTLQLCKGNNIESVGAGRNLEEASETLYKTIQDKRIAFLNFSEVEFSTAEIDKPGSNPLNPVKNYYSIKSAREQAD
jgi:poly-gamma-glutamate capsule biosynthesis protein CapA/YwtB (metallophosphatase superfamily)